MVIEVQREVVCAYNTESVAVDVEREWECLHLIVADQEFYARMLDLVVGAVAEAQPFAKGAVGFWIDKGQRVAAEFDCCVEGRQYHVHGAVDINCCGDVGIDYAAEIAHQGHDRVYGRYEFEEALDLEFVELHAETEFHIPGFGG